MRSQKSLFAPPNPKTLSADDLVEFHAARLLLLLHLCGSKNQIEGLTKLAKLDFFVRYPEYFQRAIADRAEEAGLQLAPLTSSTHPTSAPVESPMIRFFYGPWDKRYYQVIPYLESRQLLFVEKNKNRFRFTLSEKGLSLAKQLALEPAFVKLCEQMSAVKKVFGTMKGTELNDLIYRLFDTEIAQRSLGEKIQ
jgi:hypothetical protein